MTDGFKNISIFMNAMTMLAQSKTGPLAVSLRPIRGHVITDRHPIVLGPSLPDTTENECVRAEWLGV